MSELVRTRSATSLHREIAARSNALSFPRTHSETARSAASNRNNSYSCRHKHTWNMTSSRFYRCVLSRKNWTYFISKATHAWTKDRAPNAHLPHEPWQKPEITLQQLDVVESSLGTIMYTSYKQVYHKSLYIQKYRDPTNKNLSAKSNPHRRKGKCIYRIGHIPPLKKSRS